MIADVSEAGTQRVLTVIGIRALHFAFIKAVANPACLARESGVAGELQSLEEVVYKSHFVFTPFTVVSLVFSGIGHKKKPDRPDILEDISATRLSLRDPIGFPSHPHEWFSIIVILRRIV